MTETILKPLRGRLLVSVPFLNDFFFGRSVVLLTEHNELGSAGLILNKPLDTKINEAISDFPEIDAKLYLGGPVENSALFYIHTVGEQLPNSIKILNNLYWGGDYEELKSQIADKKIEPGQIKFFVGYSGWAPGQLNEEIKLNSWVISRTSTLRIMKNNYQNLWQEKIKGSSPEYEVWARFPANPSLN